MALARIKVWVAERLRFADLNGEIDNILNNALSLISPLTGALDFNNFRLNNLAPGTLGQPGMNFSGNTNTGIASLALNQVAIVVAGVAAANFTAAAAGPHVIGSGTTNTRYALNQTGTITLSGATQEAGFGADQALTNASGVSLYGMFLNHTLTNVAGATTDMAWLAINPSALTITAGSVTNASGLKIIAAPSGATNNYALWVAAGNVLFAANLQASSVGVGVAASGTAGRLTVNENVIVSGTGPHAIGGATNTSQQLGLKGAFSAANPVAFYITSALTATSGGTTVSSLVYGQGTITTQAAAFTLADAAQVVLEPPTLTIGAGSVITNASTLKITAGPTGATNNRALWVAAGLAQFDGNTLVDAIGGTAANGIRFFNNAFTVERARLTDAGIFLIGTTVATGSAAGDSVIGNTATHGAVNGAGTGRVALIGSNASNQVSLASGGADIRWGTALVALGGGVAPTFGTIGGAGPATAGQNAWLRVIDSTGAAAWVPVWK